MGYSNQVGQAVGFPFANTEFQTGAASSYTAPNRLRASAALVGAELGTTVFFTAQISRFLRLSSHRASYRLQLLPELSLTLGRYWPGSPATGS